jgi:HK97 family phage major capsid protein
MAYARLTSVALQDARTLAMNSDVVTMPREDAAVSLSFAQQTPVSTINETSATFEQITLTARDLDGYADVSLHLDQDAQNPGGVVGILLDQFVESYGQKIDSAVFAGVADPVVAGLMETDDSDDSINVAHSLEIAGTDPSAISVGSLIQVPGQIAAPRRRGAKWYASRETIWNYLMTVTDDSKHAFAMNPSNPLDFRIIGYPVGEVEEAPTPSTANAQPIALFGNLNGYIIGDRLSNLTLFRDPYSQRVNKLIRYTFFTRVAFANALPGNFVLLMTPWT